MSLKTNLLSANHRLNSSIPRHLSIMGLCCVMALCITACGPSSPKKNATKDCYTNPILRGNSNTSIYFLEGKYYFVENVGDQIWLLVSEDPTTFSKAEPHVVCRAQKSYGLGHIWHPQIIRIDQVWYIYFTADDGNTDNHQLYVLENSNADPLQGEFVMKGRISTDPENNWAIHAHVFEHRGQWYMAWSGWESRRVFKETQCIYIARMKNPWTLDSERVLISRPEYEWECQWINPDGSRATSYPVLVNETPFYFCNDQTDKVYLYYSASANWTSYHVIGQLSAEKESDLLDPASWTKKETPAFKQNREVKIYGPGRPWIIPSPDSTEYYLIYMAKNSEGTTPGDNIRSVFMQKIEIGPDGVPDLGIPIARGVELPKPSGTPNSNVTADPQKQTADPEKQ